MHHIRDTVGNCALSNDFDRRHHARLSDETRHPGDQHIVRIGGAGGGGGRGGSGHGGGGGRGGRGGRLVVVVSLIDLWRLWDMLYNVF